MVPERFEPSIDYGVKAHRMIKDENSLVPVKEIDFGIKVRILINQLKSPQLTEVLIRYGV